MADDESLDRVSTRTRPVTMKDIAIATGVSRSTVSRILSDAPISVPIAAATRSRVLATAHELGYRPNPLARALHGARTMLLGAIVRDITDPFFAGAVEAVSVAARSRGYNIVLGHAHSDASEALALAAVLEARHVDAILLLGDMRDQPRLLDDLRGTHVPVVALWQGSGLDQIPSVNVDNRRGIADAVDHLRGLGHRRIAFVGGRPLGDIRERQEAYVRAVKPLLGEIPPGYIQQVANSPAHGEAALRALARLTPRPTAIVVATDLMAVGVLRAALVAGIRVPAELSVVGFDDIAISAFTVPALTTLRMPMRRMANAAVEAAIHAPSGLAGAAIDRNGDGADTPFSVQLFPPLLVVRESTAVWPPDGMLDRPDVDGS
jgi:DNA-binding LacI/PurR family transcriptional regulator